MDVNCCSVNIFMHNLVRAEYVMDCVSLKIVQMRAKIVGQIEVINFGRKENEKKKHVWKGKKTSKLDFIIL